MPRPPNVKATKSEKGGQTIRWNAPLPGEPVTLPQDRTTTRIRTIKHVRPTPSRFKPRSRRSTIAGIRSSRRFVVVREKFLFYRGSEPSPPPVTVKALGGDKVRVTNTAGGTVGGLALVTVRNGKVGFRPLDELASGAEMDSIIPAADGQRAELAAYLVKALTAAGLYEKEAQAMVKTWDAAWLGEEGTRLLYLVPRAKTDELLSITIEPKPAELVRVLVGRHDFLTPEQEATADKQLQRFNAAAPKPRPPIASFRARPFLRRRKQLAARGSQPRPTVGQK